MGSIGETQGASVISNVAAWSLIYPTYGKGKCPAFIVYSPSFKLRFMFMSSYTS